MRRRVASWAIVLAGMVGVCANAVAEVTIVHDSPPPMAQPAAPPPAPPPAAPAPIQPPPRPSSPTEVSQADDRDLQELEAAQQKMINQVGALNAVNPLSQDASTGALDAAMSSGQVPPALKTFMGLMQNPVIGPGLRRLGESARSPEFMKAAQDIQKNKNVKWMYLGLLVYTAFYYLLRRWLLAATDRFLARLMLRFGLFFIFMGGYFLIAYAVMGQPLVVILMTFKRAFF